jgi:hypothetical protein
MQPGNLTPITGAASTRSKYPNDVSSRVIFGKNRRTAFGVAIPGAPGVEFGFLATDQSRTNVGFVIPINDAFGGSQASKNMKLGLLNRFPRDMGCAWNIYFLPKVN